ncbi:Anaphase-promoting complex subunit 10 [Glycine soja]|uniref:Anaphase-promoting complex subunit 10 n=1 Tax=Glycine soja TaxID=3848 RepID=A0A0B2RRP9_GLYSO|nr:Anaphase-promoting complex subunit 10 [Glycine soja]
MPKTARSTPTFPHIHFNTIGNRWLEPTEPPIEEKLKKTLHCCWNCVGRRKPYTALGTVVGAQSSKLSTLPVNKVLIKLLGHFVHLANHIKVSIRIVMWGFILLWQLIVLYVVFKLDESYTPSKVSIRAGDGFHNLKEIKTVELLKPTGWVYLSLSGVDPR